MGQRIRIIVWIVLILGAGIVATRYFSREPDIVLAEETYRFEQAQQDAMPAGNHVVYSRHTVTNTGRPNRDATRHPWKTLPSGLTVNAPLQVVFVHGYNTLFAESIVRGNYLARLVRQWQAQQSPGAALDFHTFSWRADFGPDNFHTAELAAVVQSGSLVDFLKSLGRTAAGAPAPRIVVIAHSLGARLVLEALARHGADADFPELAAVLLVQPAVARTSVSRGTYEILQGDNVSIQHYDGQFFPTLGKARMVIATCTATDAVLSQHYYSSTELTDAAVAAKLNTALGQPYYSSTEAEQFPANFRLIDFSPGRYLDMALPSHESLFDSSGRRALWSLWNRLLRPATSPGR